MEIVTGPDNSQNIEEELNRLVAEYQKTLLHMCSFWLKDALQAEDAVQEVYIKAYKALPGFRHECSEKTWLMRIAANVCRDMQKSRWSRFVNRSVDIANLPEPAYEMIGHDDEVIQAVQALPAQLREVILLHFWQHMSLTEIAVILNTSLSTVSRRLKDAKKRLRIQLEEEKP